MFDELFTNIFADGEVSTGNPDAEGDYYLITDAQNDHNYMLGKICDALISISDDPSQDFQILYGGEVTDGGSGTVNIAECVAISVDSSGNRRLVHLPAQTGVTLPAGYNDGNPIWAILKYDFKYDTATRAHRLGTTYHPQIEDSFLGDSSAYEAEDTDSLFTQTDPAGACVVLGRFTMTGTTFASLDYNKGIWHEIVNSKKAEATFANGIVSTYALTYTNASGSAYIGGVLSSLGEIHFVPYSAAVGQKISSAGVISTYSLVYTSASAYAGGVLTSNGDIHFIPYPATVPGQKVSRTGVVSTYALAYTTTASYWGGVLAVNGDIHYIPYSVPRGHKISSSGTPSTYSLIYTLSSGAYRGGVLDKNGDIHFIPFGATVGQKISAGGVVSTYSLVYTTSSAYAGGVIDANGDIHFIPSSAAVGQKISRAGVVSTYSLAYTTAYANNGGVLAPDGTIYFIPYSAAVGQKISSSGVVSTYSLALTTPGAYYGGIINENSEINFIPYNAVRGQKISTLPIKPWSLGMCCHPFFNKF